MKKIRRLTVVWFSLALAIFSTGCATHRPLVNTWRNPQFAPSVTNTFALTLRPHPNADDAALGRMVQAALQQIGITLGSAGRADYLLTYAFSENTEERVWRDHRTVEPLFSAQSPTPQTTSQIMAHSYNAPATVSGFRTSEYRTQDIRLYLYTNPKVAVGGLQLVWQGTINTGKNPTPEYELAMLKTLLGYFGKDQNGRVELPQ